MIPMSRENDGAAASAQVWRRIKLSALFLAGLMGAGIGALMILSAGKGEDITGVVAPALLVALISGAIATVAAFRQKRAQNNR